VQSSVPAVFGSGLHEMDEMLPCPMLIVMLCPLLPRVATSWKDDPGAFDAVIEKDPVVLPAGSITCAGTDNPLPGEERLTVVIPVLLDRVTVQELVPPGGRVVRPHVREVIAGDADNVRLVDWDAPPTLTVSAAVSSAVGAAAVAVKEAVLDPAGTVSVAGDVRSGFALATSSVTPPAGACLVKVTVHVALAPAARLAGEHVSELMPMGADDSVKLRVTPFMLAVSTAVLADGDALTLAAKFALLEPGWTVTVAGTLTSAVPVSAMDTISLPMVRLTVTVQLSWAPGLRVAGLHTSEPRLAGPSTDTTTIFELMPSVAVTLTFWSDEMVPTVSAKFPLVVPGISVKIGGVVTCALSVVTPSVIDPPVGTGPVSE
jgi:hypothetical protein